MNVQSYLFFNGRCEEALAFYGQALGAETTSLTRFKESPDQSLVAPGTEEKVMHASFRIGDTNLNASDGRCEGDVAFKGFSLTITADDEAAAQRYFTALSDGGKVELPLTRTFFAKQFAMLEDRFGLGWMIMVPA
jgi:PhnB protein